MRYLPVSHLKEGMTLMHTFYGSKFETMLMEGSPLTKQHIQRIADLGYNGIYVDDEFSRETVVETIITPDLRIRTVQAAKELLVMAETGQQGPRPKNVDKVTREHQEKIVLPVISSVIGDKRRVLDVIDPKPYEDYSYYHAAHVVVVSILLGVELGITGNELYELGLAALLHDVGNAFVPKTILNKPARLTPEEYDVVKSHSEMGFEYLKEHFDMSIDACMGALQHHENYDGSGYPNRLAKNKISIYGRILALADVFDALTSRRPFRQPMRPSEAMAYIKSKAGTMFDPQIVDVMDRVISYYPAGNIVRLNSGVRCIVLENYYNSPQRPRLRMLDTKSRAPLYVDLHTDSNFKDAYIVEDIDP